MRGFYAVPRSRSATTSSPWIRRGGAKRRGGLTDARTTTPPLRAPSSNEEGKMLRPRDALLLLSARLLAFDFLADARALARELAHVVEFRAAHGAFSLQLDRVDQRGVGLEGALDALARGHLAHRERGIDAAVLLGDHHALVSLYALALSFAQFLPELFKQFTFALAHPAPIEELRPPEPGAAERLLQPPALDLRMVAREKHRRHRLARVRFRPRVLRAVEQPVHERVLLGRQPVPERTGQLPHHGIDHDHRRELAAREHIVADRQLLVHTATD